MGTDNQNPKPQREYQTDRLVFRAREVSQAKELFALIDRNRDHLRPWMDWLDHNTQVDHTIQYIEMVSGEWEKGKIFDFSIFEKATGKLIGSFGLHTINWKNKTCHLGYWLGQEFEGKGYITEAIRAGEKWADELGFHRICLTCDPENGRSKKSAERNGYLLEARLVDEIHTDRGWRDTLQYVKFLNPSIEGRITENLPDGFSFQEVEAREFSQTIEAAQKKVFDDNEIIFRAYDHLSKEESERVEALRANFKSGYRSFGLLKYKDELAGWTWGVQDGVDSYYMVNSAVLAQFRGRGLYSRMLEITMKKITAMGFQRIWSRHNITNNAIIIPKLKWGFKITGTELSDMFGTLIVLTYLTSETRRKILDFRSGTLRPDENLKKILRL